MTKSSGNVICYTGSSPAKEEREDEVSKSALATFRSREEEIERRKLEVREKVKVQLCRAEEETKRLSRIRQELEALSDPMKKEVAAARKKIDTVSRDLKVMDQNCQKKEKEYRGAVEAFNEKSREKAELVTKFMELYSESEKMRTRKLVELEQLSRSIDSLK